MNINARPLDARLEDAACKYYSAKPAFFRVKGKRFISDTQKRWILFFLLYKDCEMDTRSIARRFGFSRNSIDDAVKKIDFRKDVFTSVSREIEDIRRLAGDPDAKIPLATLVDEERTAMIREVKQLAAKGMTQRQIAKKLMLSVSTVNKYSNIIQ